jgi:hypothetical protein
MIRHCVFIRFQSTIADAERQSILADIAALQRLVPAYLVHPAHEKAGGRIVAAAEGGIDGVFVYDFEIAG